MSTFPCLVTVQLSLINIKAGVQCKATLQDSTRSDVGLEQVRADFTPAGSEAGSHLRRIDFVYQLRLIDCVYHLRLIDRAGLKKELQASASEPRGNTWNFEGLLPENQGQHLVLTVSIVPHSFDSCPDHGERNRFRSRLQYTKKLY